jgi:4-hydroxyphenylacetate 3-hydroxylase C terminal
MSSCLGSLSAAYRVHSIEASDRADRTMEGLLTSYLILSGGASDLTDPEIGPLIERYLRGGAPSTREHLRLMAVAADMVMTPFGKRSQPYERLQSGEIDRMRQRLYTHSTEIPYRLSACSNSSEIWEINETAVNSAQTRRKTTSPPLAHDSKWMAERVNGIIHTDRVHAEMM